jgi:4-carboxymuconolactone decarboxylase
MVAPEDAMTEARFPPLAPEELSPAQQRLRAALIAGPRGEVRGPYVPLIRSPELGERMRHLGDFIRFEGELPPRLKEIVIFTVGRHWSVDYMFAVHREMSAELGLDRAIPDAIAAGRTPPGLAPAEQAAHDLALDLLRSGRASDAVFAAARAALGDAGLVELITFVGYYTTLAMLLNTAQIAAPAGAQPLPPP